MERTCDALVERFPDQRHRIESLFDRDATFRSFCRDYQEALAAVKQWADKGPEGEATRDECAMLICELEQEFLEFHVGDRNGTKGS